MPIAFAPEIVVNGNSMAPLLQPGDVVRVVPLHAPPRVGEIVTCAVPTGLNTHRVVRVDDQLWTHGDNAWRTDPPIRREAVMGRVVQVTRAGRTQNLDTAYWRAFGPLLAALLRAAHTPNPLIARMWRGVLRVMRGAGCRW